jgi:hypothetical protein
MKIRISFLLFSGNATNQPRPSISTANFSIKEGNDEENMAQNWTDFSGLDIHVYDRISHYY